MRPCIVRGKLLELGASLPPCLIRCACLGHRVRTAAVMTRWEKGGPHAAGRWRTTGKKTAAVAPWSAWGARGFLAGSTTLAWMLLCEESLSRCEKVQLSGN